MKTRIQALGMCGVLVPLVACGDDAAESATETAATTDDGGNGPGTTLTASTTDGAPTGSGGPTTGGRDTSTGDTTAGDTTSGDTTAGDTTTGDMTTTTSGDTTTTTSGDTTTTTTGGMTTTTTGNNDAMPGFVGMSTDDSLMVFDQLTHVAVAGPIDLLPDGNYPYDVTIHPDGSEVWIAGAVGDAIVVVDTATYGILHQGGFSTGAVTYAVDVAFSPDGTTAYIAGRDAEALVIVDAATYTELDVSPTPGPMDAGKMAVNPCTGQVYVVEWFGDNLMTYDPVLDSWATVDLGTASLWDATIDATGSTLYVADRGNDQVHVFDVTGGALPAAVPDASVDVGDDPWGLDITSDGSTVVVACEDDNTVHFIDTAALTATSLTLAADADPRDVDISADDLTAYVPNGDVAGDDGVYAIDIATETLTDTILLGPGANSNSLAVTPQAVTCASP